PVKTERAATVATEETINLIRDVQQPGGYNPNLLIWGILPNQYENTIHAREALADLRAQYPTLVYPEQSSKTTRHHDALDLRIEYDEGIVYEKTSSESANGLHLRKNAPLMKCLKKGYKW